MDIVADNIDSWEEGVKRVVVAIGNVKIKKVDATIDADSVILWFDKRMGRVRLHWGSPLVRCMQKGM